jgi:predicted AlkP superfamily pyrophosphatase or phosphodiesterase
LTIARSDFINATKTIALILVAAGLFLGSCIELPVRAAINQGPKLIIYLVADQFPCSYFDQCADKLQTNGFRQLLDNGANFTACHYTAATNQTACNLAVIATGAYPWSTGIVGNEWYDRRKQKLVKASSTEDSVSAAEESSPGASYSHGTTIGEELKLSTNGLSRVVSISALQSEALLLAGKSGQRAFWWDYHSGNFASMRQSIMSQPAWVKGFNEKHYSEKFLGKNWQSREASPISSSSIADESFYTQFIATPWANQMLVDFAKEAIEQESLGQRDATDLVNISFPAFEIVGKNYGAFSSEAYELVGRFDRSLADLLQFLDNKIGSSNYLIVFTAAHGAMFSSDTMKNQGLEAGIIEAASFRNQLDTALSSKLGKANWVEAFAPPNLYLNLSTIDHSAYKQPDIEKLAANLGRVTGVAEINTAFQFFMNQVPVGPQVGLVQKSYFWGRSGELYVIPKPGFAFACESSGTTCGSPYNYDAQVPLIIYGNGLKPGTYANGSDPADISPTIANMLNINAPSLAEGRVLSEALNWAPKAKYVKQR